MTGRSGRELAWANRRIRAGRGHWPDGALEACERIETAHPDWAVVWLPPNPFKGFVHSARYWATRDGVHGYEVTAPDPDMLVQAIEEAPAAEHNYGIEGCPICVARTEAQLRRAGL